MVFLKDRYNCRTGVALAKTLKIQYSTLKNWFKGRDRYLPKDIIPEEIFNKLEIIDEQENNWGNVKGGKKTYKILVEKYGLSEIKKRQSNGGRASSKNNKKVLEEFTIDVSNDLFLEFYGILMGDGWLSRLKHKNKTTYLIGISGHKILDKNFLLYCKDNIRLLFNRNPYFKELKNCNGTEVLFSYKGLFNFLNTELNFPIGKKENLKLPENISEMGYEKIKHIIRGIFDTDGSFYLDKTPANKPYPCISITMKEPILM